MEKLHIYASGIHTGGGKVLLLDLIESISSEHKGILVYDERLKLTASQTEGFQLISSSASLWGQFKAQRKLRTQSKNGGQILFFSNLPPFIKFSNVISTFMQNELILSSFKMKFIILRTLLKTFKANTNQFIVQTKSMKSKLQKVIPNYKIIKVSPLIPKLPNFSTQEKKHQFIYVASLEPHKNHQRLLETWVELSKNNLYPSLTLIISGENKLIFENNLEILKRKYSLKVKCLKDLSREQCLKHIQASQTLVFPSTNESFGLPLIEAQYYGLDIIASNLNYVKDVVKVHESFDPYSKESMTKSISRYLRENSRGHYAIDQKTFLSNDFLSQLLPIQKKAS